MLKIRKSSYSHIALWLLAIVLLGSLAACGGSDQTVQPTPTPSSSQFTTLNLGLPPEATNAPVVGPLADDTIMHVRVSFKVNQSAVNQGNDNGQVQSGQDQDLETKANQIGITDATYQQIKAVLGVQDAKLTLSKLHTSLSVDAKAKTVAAVFQTKFVQHQLNGRTYYIPATPPKLPTSIMKDIVAVTGLETYSINFKGGMTSITHKTASTHGKQLKQHANLDCTAPDGAVLPTDIAHAYGYDRFWRQNWRGQNMTINLVEIGGIDPNDIYNYFGCVNFKGSLKVVDVDGTPASGDGESTLDIDMIAGLAPNANIVDYESAGSQIVNLEDMLQQIIDDNAHVKRYGSVVSISLGAAENHLTPDVFNALDQRIQVLTSIEHMTVFVASGDCAAFADGTYNRLSVNFPASDPYAIAVGGTEIQTNNAGRANEVVWSDGSDRTQCQNAWGSGGGNSIAFHRAKWQAGNGVQNRYAHGYRQVPDISAVAFNLPIYFQGQWGLVGGTSAATPIWASGLVLLNQGLMIKTGYFFYGPKLFYGINGVAGRMHPYYDVTHGNNLYFPATAGWDYTTGFGTPNLVDFYWILYGVASKH